MTKPPSCSCRTGVSPRMKKEEEKVCLFSILITHIRSALSDGFPGH